jgi:Arc/MetJ-type ribon-helix-helix transcriptional regulator
LEREENLFRLASSKGGTLSDTSRYVTVSIPKAIAGKIDFLIDELGYWPSRSSFVREACLEKISVEERRLRGL